MSFTLRFVLRQSSEDAVFQHLALCSPTDQLIHWVVPGAAQRLLSGLPYYLLCEVPPTSPLPFHEVDSGECTIAGIQEESLLETLHHRIQSGDMQLQLQGRNFHGSFTLGRLGPDSHIWRLSVGHPIPQSVNVQR